MNSGSALVVIFKHVLSGAESNQGIGPRESDKPISALLQEWSFPIGLMQSALIQRRIGIIRVISDRIPRFIAAAVLVGMTWAVFLAWIPVTYHQPLARDQGIFAWTGTVMLHGGLPYADAWDMKGPLAHALYAGGIALFGHTEPAIRTFDVVMWTLCGIVFILIGRRLNGRLLSGLLALPFLLCLNGGDWWETAQPDLWAGMLLAASLLAVVGSGSAVRRYTIAGVLVTASALIKPLYGAFALLLIGALLEEQDFKTARRPLLWLIVGLASPLLVTIAVYGATHRLWSLWDAYLRFNLTTHADRRQIDWAQVSAGTLDVLGIPYAWGTGSLQVLAVCGAWFTMRKRRVPGMLLIGSMAFALLIAVAQKKLYLYHFMPYWVFVALAGALAIDHIVYWPFEGSLRKVAAWATAMPLLFMISWRLLDQPIGQVRMFLPYAEGRWKLHWYEKGFCKWNSDFCYHDVAAAAKLVRVTTEPGDKVYLWGFDSLLYYLADRLPPTRFGYNYPLVGDIPPYRQREREELLRDLRRDPPIQIVVEHRDGNNLMPLSSNISLLSFPELQELLRENYRPRASTARFDIYQLQSPAWAQFARESQIGPRTLARPSPLN